jgi:histone-lysine N-methyltransferase SETD3
MLQTEVSYDYPRDAFLVSAGATYVPGQQVFISYGAQNNDSLMQVRLPGGLLLFS